MHIRNILGQTYNELETRKVFEKEGLLTFELRRMHKDANRVEIQEKAQGYDIRLYNANQKKRTLHMKNSYENVSKENVLSKLKEGLGL